MSLLTTLNNPLNVSLLTGQLLQAPALWTKPDGLRSSFGFLSVFHSAANRKAQSILTDAEKSNDIFQLEHEPQIAFEDWIRAIVNGADERSPRHRHLLVLGGLLTSLGNNEEELISQSLWLTLQSAFIKAANLSLQDPTTDELADQTVVLALNYAFQNLSDFERSHLDYDSLLPMLMHATLHSSEGLRSGYFLSAADADVRQVSSNQFSWSASSTSFYQVQKIVSNPLVASLGPLARLASHTVGQVSDPWLVSFVVEDVMEFSKKLHTQWAKNKLSEVDAAEESRYLTQETRNQTLPTLWKLMRSTLFSVVIILQSAIGRTLADARLAQSTSTLPPQLSLPILTLLAAANIAQQSLHILRYLNFISSRQGSAAFSQYTFTYLTAIDILASYPPLAQNFVRLVAPKEPGRISSHPLDRVADLFFLNTAEHFTLVLPSEQNEELLIGAAAPYLTTNGNPHLLPIFESAHSVMLAVFAAPQNAEITSRHLPLYVNALFEVFPHNLSARQFRLAFRNLVSITSPPSHIANTQPLLAATLLELAHSRALHAPTTVLPADPVASDPEASNHHDQVIAATPQLSEQAVLVETLIDALPAIALDLLEEWLPICADLIKRIQDQGMREQCRQHLWETMMNGSMDSERSQTCVAWWTTRGGRETLLYGYEAPGPAMMSGALNGPKL